MDVASYRSRSRNKKKGLDRLSELEHQVKQLMDRQSQQLLEGPAADAGPSQLKSSVGSTQLEDRTVEPPAAHYPVDDITEKTNSDLHMTTKNISFPVAVGYALTNQSRATHHGGQIRAGYALVGVEKSYAGIPYT